MLLLNLVMGLESFKVSSTGVRPAGFKTYNEHLHIDPWRLDRVRIQGVGPCCG